MKKHKAVLFILISVLSFALSTWGHGLGAVIVFALISGRVGSKAINSLIDSSDKEPIQRKFELFMIGLGIFVCSLFLCALFNGAGILIVLGLLCATVMCFV